MKITFQVFTTQPQRAQSKAFIAWRKIHEKLKMKLFMTRIGRCTWVKNAREGVSEVFAKIPRGVKSFRKNCHRGSPYFGFYCIFISKCFEICLGGLGGGAISTLTQCTSMRWHDTKGTVHGRIIFASYRSVMFTLKLILSSSKLPIDVTVISANSVVPSSSCSLESFKIYVLN